MQRRWGITVADAALKDQLKAIISKATGGAVSVAAIGDDVALMDLGVDSMAALEVVMELETQFGVSITDMEAGKEAFTSINSLANFVEANRA
jgi:acyl carrier protein